jgi:ribonuclease E
MENPRNQREVENRLRDALRYDRARVQMGKISRFGLMELSRQRLQTSLGETSHIACPRCHGTGHIRSIESSALHILRILQEEAMKENTAAVHAQVPVDVATYLLNEKRSEFHAIESRMKVNVVLVPNIHLETPNYTLTRLRHDELNQMEPLPASYQLMEQPAEAEKPALPSVESKVQRPQAAVQGIKPEQPAPIPAQLPAAPKPSILQKIFGWLRGAQEAAPEPVKVKPREPRRPQREGARRDRDHRRGSREDVATGPRRGQEGGRDQGRGHQRGGSDERRVNRPTPTQGRVSDSSRPEPATEASAAGTPERIDRPVRAERPEKGERPERPRSEGAPERHPEGRGRRRRGRRERGSGTDPESARATRNEAASERRPEPDRPKPTSAQLDDDVRGSEVKTSWSEPAVGAPQHQDGVVEAVAADAAVESGSGKDATQAGVSELGTAPDSGHVVIATAMEFASDNRGLARTVSTEKREEVQQDNETQTHPERRLAQAFELPPELIQVETSPEKVHQDNPAPEPGERFEDRPRRPRPAEEPMPNEPLVQVETRH